MLYRSNKVMYDRLTNSLWNQLTSDPVIGPLWDSGIKLDFFPVILTRWEEWLELHPDTTVLDQETGLYPAEFYAPEEDPQAIYYDYFNAPETMFPVPYRNDRLETKDVVLGVQLNDSNKVYSSAALREGRIVNDVVGGEEILVLGSAASQGARAHYRGGRSFKLAPNDGGWGSPRHPARDSGHRRRDMARDRGVYGRHGRRVAEARADTDAHVILVRMVPVPPGHGVVHGALTGCQPRRGWLSLTPLSWRA